MHPLTYLHLQMGLEGIGLVGDRLVREAEALPDGDLPLLLIAKLSTGEVVTYFNESLPVELQRKLAASVPATRFPSIDPIFGVLRSNGVQTKAGHYKTYIFFTNPADSIDRDVVRYPRQDPMVQAFGFSGLAEYVFSIVCDGRVVSACASARENEQCGEAWVQTDPSYRNQGLASKVLHVWANSLVSAGKIPLYSHELGNKASAALAKHLGLKPVFEEISISRVS